jgi:hypothetical protein
MVKIFTLMCEDGKMRPVETIPIMGGGGIKENDASIISYNVL